MPLDPDALIKEWGELRNIRNPFENEWRKLALTCLPRGYGQWQTQGQAGVPTNGGALSNTSAQASGGETSRMFVPDTTAQRALPKYVALLGSLLTPQQQTWHSLAPTDPALARIKSVKDYMSQLNNILFAARYNPSSYFESTQFENYAGLGVYGSGIKFISRRRQRAGSSVPPSLLYRSCSLANTWFALNDEGDPDTVFRLVPNMTAQNVQKAFGDSPLPPSVVQELAKASPSKDTTFEILHVVKPNEDYDPSSLLSPTRYPYVGVYLATKDRMLVGEPEGYRVHPYVCARDYSQPGIAYGYSPAAMALGSIGTANAVKKTLIKKGQKAVDPPLLAYDDSVINGSIGGAPGSIIWGGLDQSGRELIKPLSTGDFEVGTQMLQDEREAINDCFFVSLYQMLNENPDMTATEVMERAAEKAALLAPTMGRLQASDLGPTIEREIDLLEQMGLLPPMPPEMQEARGHYRIVYTSPLAKQQKSEAVAAFMRASQFCAQAVQQTGDRTILARLNYNAAVPGILEATGVPPEWMNSDEEVAQIVAASQQQSQAETMAKAAPAIAGMAKAAAVAQQAGGGGEGSASGAGAAPAVAPITLPG